MDGRLRVRLLREPGASRKATFLAAQRPLTETPRIGSWISELSTDPSASCGTAFGFSTTLRILMPRFAVSAWDYDARPAPRPAHEEWIDRLSSLQVLAGHGDLDAEEQARAWLAHDPDARTVWNTVAEVCGTAADAS